jgi:hypothetical protein
MVGDGARVGEVLVARRYQYRAPRPFGQVLRRALAARLFTGAYHSTINDIAVPQVLFAVGKRLLR